MNPQLMALLQRYGASAQPQPTPTPDPVEQYVDQSNQGVNIGGYGTPGWGTENGFNPQAPAPQQQGFDIGQFLSGIGDFMNQPFTQTMGVPQPSQHAAPQAPAPQPLPQRAGFLPQAF